MLPFKMESGLLAGLLKPIWSTISLSWPKNTTKTFQDCKMLLLPQFQNLPWDLDRQGGSTLKSFILKKNKFSELQIQKITTRNKIFVF